MVLALSQQLSKLSVSSSKQVGTGRCLARPAAREGGVRGRTRPGPPLVQWGTALRAALARGGVPTAMSQAGGRGAWRLLPGRPPPTAAAPAPVPPPRAPAADPQVL